MTAGLAGGLLFISHSFDESLLKQYNKNTLLAGFPVKAL